MRFNLNAFLMSVSLSLDLAEKEILKVTTYHSRRVAYMAIRMAEMMRLSDAERFDLCSLAIMHDNGLTEAALKVGLFDKDVQLKELEDIRSHCHIGEENIADYPFQTKPKNVILYHHEHFDGSGFYGKSGDEIPLMSQILCFADTLDFQFDMIDTSYENQKKVSAFAQQANGTTHSPRVVNAFMELASHTAFWLDMNDLCINQSLKRNLPDMTIEIDMSTLLRITQVFSRIIDAKSKFTYRHTGGLIEKAKTMAHYYGFDREKSILFQIAASLHDLGKLAVPNTILDKVGSLEAEEREIIKTHTYFTHFTLRNLEGFEEIEPWASRHHEKLDGSGYPYGTSAAELTFEERLMGCLDMYQALTEERPYRQGLCHDEAMAELRESVCGGLIDSDIVQDIDKVFRAEEK